MFHNNINLSIKFEAAGKAHALIQGHCAAIVALYHSHNEALYIADHRKKANSADVYKEWGCFWGHNFDLSPPRCHCKP